MVKQSSSADVIPLTTMNTEGTSRPTRLRFPYCVRETAPKRQLPKRKKTAKTKALDDNIPEITPAAKKYADPILQ
jgi:hypothetical protein